MASNHMIISTQLIANNMKGICDDLILSADQAFACAHLGKILKFQIS
jgi:hypothetical protein